MGVNEMPGSSRLLALVRRLPYTALAGIVCWIAAAALAGLSGVNLLLAKDETVLAVWALVWSVIGALFFLAAMAATGSTQSSRHLPLSGWLWFGGRGLWLALATAVILTSVSDGALWAWLCIPAVGLMAFGVIRWPHRWRRGDVVTILNSDHDEYLLVEVRETNGLSLDLRNLAQSHARTRTIEFLDLQELRAAAGEASDFQLSRQEFLDRRPRFLWRLD